MPSAATALRTLLRDSLRLDRTQSDPVVAARNALGVAAPLVIGALNGGASLGLASTIGALQTSFADRPGPYRLRILRLLGVAVAAAVTTALAVTCSRSAVLSAGLVAVLGFLAGLLLAGGPSATQLGIAATGCALILGHTPQPPSAAVHTGLLVLAGGAGQTLLAVAAWPLGRHRPERRALAGLYRELAGLAGRPVGTAVGPPLGDQLAAVRSTLYGLGHDHGPAVEAYRVLLDESERIRREILVLAGYAERLADAGDTAGRQQVLAALAGTARVLSAIGDALDRGRPVDPEVLTPVRADFAAAEHTLTAAELDGRGLSRTAAAARLRSLAGQLRAAVETAASGATEGSRTDTGRPDGVADGFGLGDPIAVLRANLTPSSAVLRHAIRLAVLTGGSDLVLRLAGVERGYWVPLTILVVLRPDFASTFQRGTMRVLGTVVGLVLATVLVHFVPGGQWYAIGLITVFFFGLRLAGPGNVGLSAVGLAALVVILLSLAGVPAHTAVWRRGIDTVAGGVLALLATLVWPVWEREQVPARLAALLAAYRDYTVAVADLSFDLPRMQRARSASRLARTNAQASVDRVRVEPVPGQPQADLGEAVLAHSHRYVHAMLTVDGLRPALRAHGEIPALTELLGLCATALDRCDQALRTGSVPARLPNLRAAQERLATELTTAAALAPPLLDASDRLVNSLDTLARELVRQLGHPAPVG